MFCPKCGNQVSDDAQFCGKCGYRFPGGEKGVGAPGRAPAPAALANAPRGLAPTVAGGVALLTSLLPWVDLSTIHASFMGMTRDLQNGYLMGLVDPSYSLWGLTQLGGRMDALLGTRGGLPYQVFFGLFFAAFLVCAALVVIGAVRRMTGGKKGLLNVGLVLTTLFCAVFFLLFVTTGIGGNVPVIALCAAASVAGIVLNLRTA
ncbi:zinc ribbon domain-containing protein [Thermophilibacter sp.]